jgi:hypothetical protein
MINARRDVRILPRGRVAKWSKEQIDKLSTPEVRTLLANAERLLETEVAAICNEILDARPRGRPPVRRDKHAPLVRRLVTRRKAFEMRGVSGYNRVWSRGGIGADGAVVMTVASDEVEKREGAMRYLLWAPNVDDSRPWSDSPGGKERLEHCRLALERGAAQGLMIYGARVNQVDAENVLSLRVEKHGDEYWATWTPEEKRVVKTFE